MSSKAPGSGSPASTNRGPLLVIGGHEDRERDKTILSRFVELAGGPRGKIVVLTAASKVPRRMWEMYDRAFAQLGVRDRSPVHIPGRAQADDPQLADEVASAQGIFMVGGDQKRLLAMIGNTALHAAMRRAVSDHGACIAGTSAGASAMSAHMLAQGRARLRPRKGLVRLAPGLGFVQRAVIDQHFSRRQRLARLLTVVAHHPRLLGIGIDENTALMIGPRTSVEVIGEGAVTLIDGRHMISNVGDIATHQKIEVLNAMLHVLPSGVRYEAGQIPDALQDLPDLLTTPASPA